MKLLEERIIKDGKVYDGDVLKVDNFLNHQIDCLFIDKLGEEIYDHFKTHKITKILTVESSGIALAMAVALKFKAPVLFAKKTKAANLSNTTYSAKVYSFTRNVENTIFVEKAYLTKDDNILIVDDFLAKGSAIKGLIEVAKQAGASVKGISVAIEKGFQGGGDELRAEGHDLLSLAIIDKMVKNEIIFR